MQGRAGILSEGLHRQQRVCPCSTPCSAGVVGCYGKARVSTYFFLFAVSFSIFCDFDLHLKSYI